MPTLPLLRLFGWIAIAEGISYLALFFITMPLKYGMGMPEPNLIVGMAHGILFIAYVILAMMCAWHLRWPWKTFFWVFVASLVPFATFYMERTFLRRQIDKAMGTDAKSPRPRASSTPA